jgi:hypothetical protein
VVFTNHTDLGDLSDASSSYLACSNDGNDGSLERLTSAAVKLLIANVLNLPCSYSSLIALSVGWKGTVLSADYPRSMQFNVDSVQFSPVRSFMTDDPRRTCK